jgi:cytochrome c-type biogenesis protein CcmH
MTRLPLALAPLLLAALASRAASQAQPSPTTSNAVAVVGAPSGSPRAGALLDTTTRDVASLLRCPVCQGTSVWDSPATMAVNMKRQVRALVAAGFSRDQILRYFQSSYGDFVLLSPPTNGVSLLVWVLPPVVLIAGGFMVRRLTSRGGAAAADTSLSVAPVAGEEWPGPDTLPADDHLARCVLAVRDLAYGSASGADRARTDLPGEERR